MPFGQPGDITMKMVLIGDGAVGKTSIRRNYLGQGFNTSHLATIGVDFCQKYTSYRGVNVRQIIWDLAGQPSYESVRRHYYQGSAGILLVYSVINRESFDNASRWLVEAYKYMKELPPVAILANKIDLRSTNSASDVVTTEEGLRFKDHYIEKLNMPAIFQETSALRGEGVQEVFDGLTGLMIDALSDQIDK